MVSPIGAGKIVIQRSQEKYSEPPPYLIGSSDQRSAQDDLLAEALGQILGLFVIVSTLPDISIDGLPIQLQELTQESSTVTPVIGLNLVDY
jgi:hypothetical protein